MIFKKLAVATLATVYSQSSRLLGLSQVSMKVVDA